MFFQSTRLISFISKRVFVVSLALVGSSFCAFSFDWPKTIFEDAFETGELASWFDSRQNGAATLMLSSEFRRSGRYSLKSTIPANAQPVKAAAISHQIKERDSLFARVYVMISKDFDMALSDFTSIMNIGRLEQGLVDTRIRKTVADSLLLELKYGATIVEACQLSKGQWHCIEVFFSPLASGRTRLWVDGILRINRTNTGVVLKSNAITLGVNTYGASSVMRGSIYFDDLVVDTAFIGPKVADITLVAPDLNSRIGAKIPIILTGDSPTDRLIARLGGGGMPDRTVSFSGPLNGYVEYKVDLRDLPAANYQITVTLSDTAGNTKAFKVHNYSKKYSGNPILSIDENNNLVLNGKKFFPVTTFGLLRTAMVQWRDNDYCNMLLGIDWNKPDAIQGYGAYLNLAKAANLYCIGPMHDARFDDPGEPRWTDSDVQQYVDALKGDSQHVAWCWREEPDNFGYDAISQKRWWDIGKNSDPRRPTEIILMGAGFITTSEGYRHQLRSYHWPQMVADIYSHDYYPIELQSTMDSFALAIDRAYEWNFDLAPVIPFIQSTDCVPGERGGMPTVADVNLMCWLSVIHKAKGIHWYPYQGMVTDSMYRFKAQFVRDIKHLTEAILSDSSTAGVRSSVSLKDGLHFMEKTWNNQIYIFAANSKKVQKNVTFTLTNMPSTAQVVSVYNENRTLTFTGNSFSDVFRPQQVHVYVIGTKAQSGKTNSNRKNILSPTMRHNSQGLLICNPNLFAIEYKVLNCAGRVGLRDRIGPLSSKNIAFGSKHQAGTYIFHYNNGASSAGMKSVYIHN